MWVDIFSTWLIYQITILQRSDLCLRDKTLWYYLTDWCRNVLTCFINTYKRLIAESLCDCVIDYDEGDKEFYTVRIKQNTSICMRRNNSFVRYYVSTKHIIVQTIETLSSLSNLSPRNWKLGDNSRVNILDIASLSDCLKVFQKFCGIEI